MIVKVNVKVGGADYEYTIDEREEMEALHKAIVLGNPKTYCPFCKSTDNTQMDTNKATSKDPKNPGTFTYVNVWCRKCGAKSNLGQYKAGGYYWKAFEQYNSEGNDENA